MSKKRVWIGALILLAGSTPAFAQVAPEVSVTVGWTFADGVSGDAILAGDGNIYDRIDPEDAFNWGLGVGIPVSENAEVGFLFGQQMTTLLAGGTTETEIGDLTISSYHGYFGYNFGDADAAARPYVLFGLGATSYGSVPFTTRGGVVGRDRRVHELLDHVGRRHQGVRFAACRLSRRAPLDPDLHQVRRCRLVVRSVLGLLRGGRLPVCPPVVVQRGHPLPLLSQRASSLCGRAGTRALRGPYTPRYSRTTSSSSSPIVPPATRRPFSRM